MSERWGLDAEWVEAGRMLNELSGSLSSCILVWIFSIRLVQRKLPKDFLVSCAHASDRNGVFARFSLRAVRQVAAGTPQFTCAAFIGS